MTEYEWGNFYCKCQKIICSILATAARLTYEATIKEKTAKFFIEYPKKVKLTYGQSSQLSN